MNDAPSQRYPYGERRLAQRLLRYWHECRGDRAMPEENDIDPDVLGADWERCFVLQTRDLTNTVDYNFTYLGRAIIDAYRDNQLGGGSSLLVSTNASMLSGQFTRVLKTQMPILDEGEFVTAHGRRVLYRQCIMPLGHETRGVEAFLGGMGFKFTQ